MKKTNLLLTLTTLVSAAFAGALLVIGALILLLNSELPSTSSIKEIELKIPLRVYTSEGLLISEFGDERRIPLDIQEFPKELIHAILSAEDNSFFDHNGIDLKGITRAALKNFTSSSSRKHGASTITQQVARNFFLSPEQTYTRKIKEIFVAIKLEQTLTKNEILSLYLNKIFLGHRAYGFGAAAEVYYGKPLEQLNIAELAMLSGLPKAPSSYNPISNPERALTRRDYILGRLLELDYINKSEHAHALETPVTAKRHRQKTDVSAPHIAEMVRAKLVDKFGADVYWQGLKVITTIHSTEQVAAEKALRNGLQKYDQRHGFRGSIGTVDLSSEITLEERKLLLAKYPSSQEQIPALVVASNTTSATAETVDNGTVTLTLEQSRWAKRHRTQNRVGDRPTSMSKLLNLGDVIYIQPVEASTKTSTEAKSEDEEGNQQWRLSQIPNVSGSLISIDPQTGELISLVGGYDFFLNKYNRAIQSIRQPGSNIKPFIYSASLDKGFTPATLISGAPIVIRDPNHGTLWRPENYSGEFFGPTRMRAGLAKSMNLISIRLLRSIGIPYAREYTARFGIDMSRFSPTLTMALGSGGATPLEILTAYSTLANGGYKIEPNFIKSIINRHGETLYQAPTPEFCDECYQRYLEIPEEAAPSTLLALENEAVDSNDDPLALSYEAPRVMSHANNFLTVNMLKDVITRGTARKALVLEREDLAGKTGTTNDYVDAWFSGFNSKIATTVWVGFDKPISMGRGEAGGVAALPIWIEYMSTALNNVPEDSKTVPEYIEEGFINRETGQKTDESEPNTVKEFFVIPELTPEYALTNNLKEQPLTNSELDTSPDIEIKPESLTTNAPSVDLDKEGIDSEIEGTDDKEQPQGPRVIENANDTEGLF